MCKAPYIPLDHVVTVIISAEESDRVSKAPDQLIIFRVERYVKVIVPETPYRHLNKRCILNKTMITLI